MAETKVAIVTGGSSGIGRAAARYLAGEKCKVYEFSRHAPKDPAEGIVHIDADVSCEESVKNAAGQVLELEGRVDILINCAGFGISGAIEFTDTNEAVRQLDVNFFGTVRSVKAVLPSMREAQSGRIVNISSLAGPISIPFQSFYSASKAAVIDYTMALANEVRPYGVTVCAVMPGDTCTGFTAARQKSILGDEEYGGRISRSVSRMERDEQGGMSADEVGKYIARVALKKRVKPLRAIGFENKIFTVLIRMLPCRLSNWMVGRLYAL